MANLTQLESDEIDYDPNNLLDTLIKHLHLKNDAALSRALEVAPPVISKIRHRRLPVGVLADPHARNQRHQHQRTARTDG
jgi:hypothetical protein